MIRLITLAANCAGARSAVNPHATCDAADVGNGATENPKRARRGKPRIQAKDDPTGYRASVRPYHAADGGAQPLAFGGLALRSALSARLRLAGLRSGRGHRIPTHSDENKRGHSNERNRGTFLKTVDNSEDTLGRHTIDNLFNM